MINNFREELKVEKLVSMQDVTENLKALIKEIYRVLDRAFPDLSSVIAQGESSPLERMIRIILSQNTNDKLALSAFNRLKQRFDNLYSLTDAPLSSIEEAVSVSGMKHQKAKTIKAVISSLDKLYEVEKLAPAEALRILQSIPGIGPKSARVFLLFQYGKPVFPVDTHVYRIFKRLGWLGEIRKPVDVSVKIERLGLTAGELLKLHLALIKLGRTICKSREPDCQNCPLRHLCLTAEGYN